MEKETETKEEAPINAGVEEQWLKAILQQEVEKPEEWSEQEVKTMVAGKPTSRIQELLQEMYFWLIDGLNEAPMLHNDQMIGGPSEDMFYDFYDSNDLEHYTHTHLLSQHLNTILRGLHLREENGYGEKKQIRKQLSKIAQKCIEEPEYVGKVKDIINMKYPGLIGDLRSAPSIVEINEGLENEYNKKLTEIDSNIKSNIDKYADYLAKIKRAKKTDFEEIAQELNKIVIFGESLWEIILYAVMSPYAPRLLINNMDYRSNLHTMLAGDISTAKSKILKLCKLIAPKFTMVDDTTKATFEGIAKMGEGIGEGVIELANNGVIVVEEFNNQFAKLPLFRRVMDCEPIVIWKMGEEKHITDVNITMLTACNPKQDFFVEETDFRNQLSFKEGVLSRFDFLIPLTATQIKNEILLDKIDIMTPQAKLNGINLDDIKENLNTIATGMSQITRVIMTPEQSEMLKDAFRGRNDMDKGRRLIGYRPLVILRDLETLARMVNIVAAVNFSKRIPDNGVIQADDSDIEKAIQLWEGLIQFRVQLYAKHDRNLLSVGDEIVKQIIQAQQANNGDPVDIKQIKHRIVEDMKLIGQTTFYKEINTMHETGRIAVEGQRNKKLSVIVR